MTSPRANVAPPPQQQPHAAPPKLLLPQSALSSQRPPHPSPSLTPTSAASPGGHRLDDVAAGLLMGAHVATYGLAEEWTGLPQGGVHIEARLVPVLGDATGVCVSVLCRGEVDA